MFYLSFGLVVTSSVHIAGVLLVFSFLIVPAVGAILFSDTIPHRLFLGWEFGVCTSVIGIAPSYFLDFPTGRLLFVFLEVFWLCSLWQNPLRKPS